MLKFLAGVAVAMSFSACSDIAEEDRLVYVAPSSEVNRKVLIEDFTGQRCVNCPNATEAIHQMQSPEAFGDNVVAVAIHCGPFGILNTNPKIGLMTPAGKEYWEHWFTNDQGQPVAKINRGAANSDYLQWSALVSAALKQTSDVQIMLKASCDLSADSQIAVEAILNGTPRKEAKVQVWLTEDNIVAQQLMPDGKPNKEYAHNHVFRAAVNGLWGEDIRFGTEPMHTVWYVGKEDYWKLADMNAVVFVYDESGVLQVESCKLTIVE